MPDPAKPLQQRHCVPCEGGAAALPNEKINELLKAIPAWKLTADGRRIHREWKMRDFAAGLVFFQGVGEIAEAEDHHPDLHLTGYRNVTIELSTHAVGGLTENDFILAAKIDGLPAELKT